MGKIIAPLAIAAALFAAGGVTAAILGEGHAFEAIKQLDMYSQFQPDDVSVNEIVDNANGVWSFNAAEFVGISTSSIKTYIQPSDGNEITLSVDANNCKAAVKVMEKDGYLAIGIDTHFRFAVFGFFDNQEITARISLPKTLYEKMELRVGSGTMEAQDIRANANTVNVSSGKLSYSMAKDFKADALNVKVGSGSAEITGIAAANQDVNVSSGKLSYSMAKDFKADEFNVYVGSGSVEITGVAAAAQDITVRSGELALDNAAAATSDTLKVDLSSGSIVLKNVSATDQDISVKSGDLALDNVKGSEIHNMSVKVTSGSTEINNAAAQGYAVCVSSGDLALNGLAGQGSIEVTSGKVTAEFDKIGSSKFNVSSGDLKIILPKDTHANLTAKASSGAVIVDACGACEVVHKSADLKLGNGGDTELTANVTSGKITIQN